MLNKQPLLQPKRLPGLTTLDHAIIVDNLDVFRRSGFDFVETLPDGKGTQPLYPAANSRAAAGLVNTTPGEQQCANQTQGTMEQEDGIGTFTAQQQQQQQPQIEPVSTMDRLLSLPPVDGGVTPGDEDTRQHASSIPSSTAMGTAAPGDGGGDGGRTGVLPEPTAAAGDEVCDTAAGELLLSAVPYSRGVQFGVDEVIEMVEALAAGEGPAADVRPRR